MKKKEREEAVAEYLEEKEKEEEAPVSQPSETPVDELLSTQEKRLHAQYVYQNYCLHTLHHK